MGQSRRPAVCRVVRVPADSGGAVKILTWNLQWAKPTSWRSAPILRRLESEAADIAILTEAQLEVAHSIVSHLADAGPHPRARQPNGSKVVIASGTTPRWKRSSRFCSHRPGPPEVGAHDELRLAIITWIEGT